MKNGKFLSVGSVPITAAEASVIGSYLSKSFFFIVDHNCELLKDNFYAQMNLMCEKPIKDKEKNTHIPKWHSIIVRNKIDANGQTQYSANITLYGLTKEYRKRSGFQHGEIMNCYMYDTCLNTLCENILTEYNEQKYFYL